MDAKVVMSFAVGLIGLGIGMFFGTGATSPTALIPAAFGGLLLLTGALARNPRLYWRATVGTTVVALIGCLSTIVSLLTYSAVVGPAAVVAKVIMVVLCGWLLLLCFQSFWQKRQTPLSRVEASAGELTRGLSTATCIPLAASVARGPERLWSIV